MNKRILATALVLAAGLSQAQARPNIVDLGSCGNLHNHYGPFDYRTANPDQKNIVEIAHFTSGVETFTRHATGPFGGDIAYTLRVFPNHARALLAMERLAERERTDQPVDAKFPIECYFIRAVSFTPDDHIPRLLYADFLARRNRPDEARQQLDYVARTTQDNPLAQLNVGKMYFELKDYDKALIQAHRIIEMGFDRPDLKNALSSVGRWVEPSPQESPASAASAASSTP